MRVSQHLLQQIIPHNFQLAVTFLVIMVIHVADEELTCAHE